MKKKSPELQCLKPVQVSMATILYSTDLYHRNHVSSSGVTQ